MHFFKIKLPNIEPAPGEEWRHSEGSQVFWVSAQAGNVCQVSDDDDNDDEMMSMIIMMMIITIDNDDDDDDDDGGKPKRPSRDFRQSLQAARPIYKYYRELLNFR